MTLTTKQKAQVTREAKAAAEYMKNGIHRGNTWVRVCLIYKGSHATPNVRGISRLVDALSIHFDGVGFASTNIGAHYEIACSSKRVANLAAEYVNGWLAK
jgi:hypothetical protein